jgi:hypothetical protein
MLNMDGGRSISLLQKNTTAKVCFGSSLGPRHETRLGSFTIVGRSWEGWRLHSGDSNVEKEGKGGSNARGQRKKSVLLGATFGE